MLHGIRCGNCDGNMGSKPYVTAYEIAVKHGFQGTEEEWINTIGCIYLAKVTEQAGGDWACSDSYADLVAISEYKELHLVTLDGKIAFLNGIDESKITFCTTSYETDDGTVYDKYELPVNGEGDYEQVDVSNETGTITIDRLAAGIQTSLGKADTAYQKPAGGIPTTDMTSAAAASIQAAKIVYVNLITIDGVIKIDGDHADLNGYNSIDEAIAAHADVRIAHTGTVADGSPYIVHPFTGVLSGSLVFSGPELYLDDGYAFREGFYILTNSGGEISVEKYTCPLSAT